MDRVRAGARALASTVKAASWSSRIEVGLTVAMVVAGMLLRMRGMVIGPTVGFWTDEATWAMRLIEWPLADHLVRPPAFVLLSKLSIAVFGYTELAFRLVPWLFGLATPVVAALVGRRYLWSPGARLLLVGVLSFSLSAIDYSKEFKPYPISIFFHLFLPLLALRWIETRRTRDLVVFGIAAPLGVCFVQDVIFLYPGLFLVVLWEAWQSGSRRQLVTMAALTLICASTVLGMYLAFWKRVPEGRDEYWGDKYGVFYRPSKTGNTQVEWVWSKYVDMVQFPGDRRSHWSQSTVSGRPFREAQSLDRLVWFFLHVAGVAAIIGRRRWREGLLFWSPVLVCGVFNFLGLWPFGGFRTNLFAIANMSAVAALAVDRRTRHDSIWRALLPVGLIVLLPLALFERSWNARKQFISSPEMPAIIERLLPLARAGNASKELLVLHHHSMRPFVFYSKYHPAFAGVRDELQRRFTQLYKRELPEVYSTIRQQPVGQRVWLILVRHRGALPRDVEVQSTYRRRDFTLYSVRRR